ncbi:hypothetical protein [Halogeometricum limi]|nr:hypothetical protein [Halogeometricum limi]
MSPGPAAAYAFRLGITAGAIVGLALLGLLYWLGQLAVFQLAYVLLIIFPLYLVLVAVALSVWLGYDKDTTSLRPVYRSKEPK